MDMRAGPKQKKKRCHTFRHFGNSQVWSLGLVPSTKGCSSLDSAGVGGAGGHYFPEAFRGGGGKAQKKNGIPFFGPGCLPFPSFYYQNNLQPYSYLLTYLRTYLPTSTHLLTYVTTALFRQRPSPTASASQPPRQPSRQPWRITFIWRSRLITYLKLTPSFGDSHSSHFFNPHLIWRSCFTSCFKHAL